MNPSRWSLPFVVFVGGLVLAALVARWLLETGSEVVPARPGPVRAGADNPPAPAARAGGNGLFGQPLASTHHERRDDGDATAADENEDMPRRAAPGSHPHTGKRRHGHETERRRGDPHAIFSADIATPYASNAQSTRDDVAGLDGESGTISLWLLPLWLENSHDDATLVVFGDERVRLIKNVSFLRFEIVDRLGGQSGVGGSIADWRAGDWHQVVATWDGRVIALYLDGGQIMAAAQYAPIDLPPGTPVYVGSAFPPGRPVAPAVMAGVTIRDRALTPSAVARRFQVGPRPGE